MNKQHVKLTETDREYLEAITSKGELKVRTYRRALSLLELDRRQTYTVVSKTVKMTIGTLSTLAEQYREKGTKNPQFSPVVSIFLHHSFTFRPIWLHKFFQPQDIVLP